MPGLELPRRQRVFDPGEPAASLCRLAQPLPRHCQEQPALDAFTLALHLIAASRTRAASAKRPARYRPAPRKPRLLAFRCRAARRLARRSTRTASPPFTTRVVTSVFPIACRLATDSKRPKNSRQERRVPPPWPAAAWARSRLRQTCMEVTAGERPLEVPQPHGTTARPEPPCPRAPPPRDRGATGKRPGTGPRRPGRPRPPAECGPDEPGPTPTAPGRRRPGVQAGQTAEVKRGPEPVALGRALLRQTPMPGGIGHGQAAQARSPPDAVGLPTQGGNLLVPGRLPHAHRPVIARRGEAPAIGAEAHPLERPGVSLESEGLLSGLRVPHAHRSVRTGGGEALPSGLKHTLLTALLCPLRVRASRPVAASHTFTVLSPLAEARRLPSGLKHTLKTAPLCPLRVKVSCPVAACHSFTVPSALAEARCLPSGRKHTHRTLSVCPRSARSFCPVCADHERQSCRCSPRRGAGRRD